MREARNVTAEVLASNTAAPRRRLPGLRALRCSLAPLGLAAGLAGCERTVDSVVFGLVAPLQTTYGSSARLGAELAQREVNALWSEEGRRLELRLKDDAADPERAAAQAMALYADAEVVAVVGPVNSGSARQAAPIFNRGLPAVATGATSPGIARLGPWIFRVASSDSANAVALARQARRLGRRGAVLYANDEYGRGLAAAFADAFRAAGGQLLESDPYLETTTDFSPYLQRLRARGAQVVLVAGLEDGAARILAQADSLGLGARFLGGDGLEGLAAAGSRHNGVYVGLLFHPAASTAARDFATRFQTAYGRAPDSDAALAYDAVHLLARAAAEAGARRGSIRGYLARLGRPDGVPPLEGAAGTLRFDENGDPQEKRYAIGVIRDGAVVLNGGGR